MLYLSVLVCTRWLSLASVGVPWLDMLDPVAEKDRSRDFHSGKSALFRATKQKHHKRRTRTVAHEDKPVARAQIT
jgi:hypothetical protein